MVDGAVNECEVVLAVILYDYIKNTKL